MSLAIVASPLKGTMLPIRCKVSVMKLLRWAHNLSNDVDVSRLTRDPLSASPTTRSKSTNVFANFIFSLENVKVTVFITLSRIEQVKKAMESVKKERMKDREEAKRNRGEK